MYAFPPFKSIQWYLLVQYWEPEAICIQTVLDKNRIKLWHEQSYSIQKFQLLE